MKYLQDYMTDAQTAAFDKAGAFFAFSTEQFNEQKKEGVRYMNLYAGLVCPVETAQTLLEELDAIHKRAMREDMAENGVNAIIARELRNYECYYSGEIEDAVLALAPYGITEEHVRAVYKNQNAEVPTPAL